jgi:molecular chaperone HtpG
MSNPETHSFQAEIQQVLNLVIHSLYTDKEIFVRELVSNAADALEKVRFLQSSGQTVRDDHLPLKVRILTNESEHTLTFADSGIGMTREELIANLGTIARSGSKEFLKQLSANPGKPLDLIGQFGVGFYSAFMVADKVVVRSCSGQADAPSHQWTSTGTGSYTIEPISGLTRGTEIVLHLKEDARDFAKDYQLERILKRYSTFVPFPVELNGKQVSTAQAIWTRSKSEIKEEEYKEFFQYFAHDHEDPRYRLHFSADAPLMIRSLLFVPKNNLEKLGFNRQETDVHLYCKRVLIQSKTKDLLPEWMRFVKGVVESDDLPLNISRESMQDSALLQKIGKVVCGRFLKMLEEEAKANPETYADFYQEFGRNLKEGVAMDYAHREPLSRLLRFESSTLEANKLTSLADYVSRMGSDQKEIYYLFAPSRVAAENSPFFEVFKSRGIEVLFCYDPYDEFVIDHLREFDGKTLVAAEKAKLDLSAADREKLQGLTPEDAGMLASWMKDQLKDKVNEVAASTRLVDNPALVFDDDPHLTTSMRKLMRTVQKDSPSVGAGKLRMEINSSHPIMVRLNKLRFNDSGLAQQITEQLYDNALLSAGLLDDPRTMLKRLNQLLERAMPNYRFSFRLKSESPTFCDSCEERVAERGRLSKLI